MVCPVTTLVCAFVVCCLDSISQRDDGPADVDPYVEFGRGKFAFDELPGVLGACLARDRIMIMSWQPHTPCGMTCRGACRVNDDGHASMACLMGDVNRVHGSGVACGRPHVGAVCTWAGSIMLSAICIRAIYQRGESAYRGPNDGLVSSARRLCRKSVLRLGGLLVLVPSMAWVHAILHVCLGDCRLRHCLMPCECEHRLALLGVPGAEARVSMCDGLACCYGFCQLAQEPWRAASSLMYGWCGSRVW